MNVCAKKNLYECQIDLHINNVQVDRGNDTNYIVMYHKQRERLSKATTE